VKEGRYTIQHTINMGNYENVKLEHTVLFDIDEAAGSVEEAFATARSHIDKALATDLERVAQCTALSAAETYIHDWIEEVN
jgi:hypothetical protein